MGMPVEPVFSQLNFRGRSAVPNPTGINTAFDGSDPIAGADWTQDADTTFRVRFVILQSVTGATSHIDMTQEFALQYNYDGGGWTNVPAQGADTDPVQYADGDFTDGDATSQLVGSAQFVAGEGVEVTPTGTITFTNEPGVVEETEVEFAVEIVSGQAVQDKTFQLRVIYSDEDESPPATAFLTYTDTPTITVNIPAGPVEVVVPLATLALTGLVPTIQTPRNVQVPLGTLVLTGLVPTIQTPRNVDVPLATLVLTGLAPTVTVTEHVNVATPLATLVLTGFAPTVTVSGGVEIDVPLATLVLTGLVPTIAVSDNQFVNVPLAALVLAGLVPTIATTENRLVDVPLGTLALMGYAPTVVAVGEEGLGLDKPERKPMEYERQLLDLPMVERRADPILQMRQDQRTNLEANQAAEQLARQNEKAAAERLDQMIASDKAKQDKADRRRAASMANLAKAQVAKEQKQARRDEITKQRRKNLQKARRKLKRQREKK